MTTSMEKTLQRECGLEARAENDDGLAAEIQRHAVEAHGMALSAEQALLLGGSWPACRNGVVSPGRGPNRQTKPREIPN